MPTVDDRDRMGLGSRSALPVPVTSFVGRESEIAHLVHELSETRLITLTGMGGVGKTRLALRAADELAPSYVNGVWLVNLENLQDGLLLWETVASALGVQHHPSQTIQNQLIHYLAHRELLLILDNCEHLVDACASLVSDLLSSTQSLTVLATSRRALDITGEQVLTVAPLPVPSTEETDAQGSAVMSVAAVDSVRLFLDRAHLHRDDFELTPDNSAAVARLCVRLEGLPLAIELAANRLRTLGVEQVLERLEDRYTILGGYTKNTPPRQRTLRALVDWSYALCGRSQQLMWSRLSVFAGMFDLDSVESVCTDDDVITRVAVLDIVDELVSQSILLAAESGSRVRYRMLETIREYGLEQLQAQGEEEKFRRRHRDYYLSLARTGTELWCGPGQSAGIARLRAEHQNIRSALRWSLATEGEAHAGLDLASELRFHWIVSGMLSEGRQWLERALAATSRADTVRARALWVSAWAAILQGDDIHATEAIDECLTLSRSLGDDVAEAYGVQMLGSAALFAGDMPRAVTSLDKAIAMHETHHDAGGILIALFQNAIALIHNNEPERARATCERALALSDACGEKWARAYALWSLSVADWLRGDLDLAESRALDALGTIRTFHDAVCTALILDTLACIADTRGSHARAAVLLGIERAVWEPLGTTIGAFGPHLDGHHSAALANTRTILGDNKFESLLEDGARHDPDQRIEWILQGLTIDSSSQICPNGVDPLAPLTRRERQVAGLLVQGMSNREMADHLVLSLRTIEGHMENILSKLGCSSRSQVVALVVNDGVVTRR